jgi:hypothetical protein
MKALGTRWESDVVRFINESWGETTLAACRLVQTGSSDQGDIKCGSFILQARDRAQLDLSGSVDDAHSQLATYQRLHPSGEAEYGAAVIKRRRRGIAEGYVVLTLADFAKLLGELA